MQLNIKNVAVLLLLLAVTLNVGANPRTSAQMKQAAAKAINQQRAKLRLAPKQSSEMTTLKAAEGYEIIGQKESGFAVISKDDLVPEVLGVSTKQYNEKNTNFQWWLKVINEVVETAAAQGIQLTSVTPDPSKYPTQVGPLMTTEWDQLEPYNNLLPTASGGRCYTGCVATAMAQVLNYFQAPEHGYGSRTIYYGSSPVSADFEHTYYDWDNMRDTYSYGNYSNEEAQAVAVLMRDCGVAADMEYGGSAEGGSGAYSQDAAEGLRLYFGFTEATCYERDNYYGTTYYSDEEWMDMVFKALSEDGPIYYGGADTWNGGHAFVLHGYNAQGKVYVNWGWSGDDDGYYDISLLNPGYYQFSVGQDMIIGVKGAPRDLISKDLTITTPGTLNQEITDEMISTIGSLKVTGNINSTDIRQIRRLAGIDEYGEKTKGYLSDLDLSAAHIVEGGNAYLIDGSKQLNTTNDELSDRTFYGCRSLKSLKLPAGLKTFGDGALALCPQLSTIEIGTPAPDASFVIEDNIVWNKDKTEIIEVLPNKSGELSIPRGTTSLHDYACAGNLHLSDVSVPLSVEVIGREAFNGCGSLNEIHMSASEPPTLGGANVFNGVKSSCLLYVPSGSKTKYGQKAQWNNFKGDDYDNIVEYGSSVRVRNTIRKYGEENPTFTYYVSGDQINGVPELTCEATPESPAGRYPITITMGTITDDAVTLIDGYLVVQKRNDVSVTATVNDATREVGEEDPEFTLTYSEGLLFNAIAPVWLSAPVFTTTATIDSPEGEYPITVNIDGAIAESYELSIFTFVPGTLTITPSTKPEEPQEPEDVTTIHAVSNSVHNGQTVFDLQGRRVVVNGRLPKGIYIIDGKKMVVR